MEDTTQETTPGTPPGAPRASGAMKEVTLFKHRMRPDWGLARCVWERERKQCMAFEDGTRRVFASSHADLFEPVGTALRAADELVDEDAEEARPRLTMAGQIAHFEKLYPNGFSGDRWIEQHRAGKARQLKRHLDPAIARVRDRLSRERIESLRDTGDFGAIRDAVVDVLTATDLVRVAKVKPLQAAVATRGLVDALLIHLYGSGPERARFDAWRQAMADLDVPLDWTLATALRALAEPANHTAVRPSVSDLQARMALPSFHSRRAPDPNQYQRYLMAAERVRDELKSCGHEPVDLLDVYRFSWVTLRPSARDETARLSRTH